LRNRIAGESGRLSNPWFSRGGGALRSRSTFRCVTSLLPAGTAFDDTL